MAFARENILSGHGPQLPELSVPQGGAPVVQASLVDPAAPSTPLDLVARLALQDDEVYADWAATEGAVNAVVREAWTDTHAIFTAEAEVTDADAGAVKFTVPEEATTEPGLFLYELQLVNKDEVIVLINGGYMEVTPSLIFQQQYTPLSVASLRRQLRDIDPRANRLLEECEFTIPEVQAAIQGALDAYHSEPPMLGPPYATVRQFPWPGRLADGAIVLLLRQAALWYARNDLRVRAAGLDADDMGKAELYLRIADQMNREWVEWVRYTKRNINVSRGFGTTTSSIYGRY